MINNLFILFVRHIQEQILWRGISSPSMRGRKCTSVMCATNLSKDISRITWEHMLQILRKNLLTVDSVEQSLTRDLSWQYTWEFTPGKGLTLVKYAQGNLWRAWKLPCRKCYIKTYNCGFVFCVLNIHNFLLSYVLSKLCGCFFHQMKIHW